MHVEEHEPIRELRSLVKREKDPRVARWLQAVVLDRNAERVNQLLGEFSRHLGDDEHAVLVWDQAGFHTAGQIKVPRNVTLLPLPPYSPELNVVENLWHHLRSHHWSNRCYDDLLDLSDGIDDAAKRLRHIAPKLRITTPEALLHKVDRPVE